jgi:hypothetical protein
MINETNILLIAHPVGYMLKIMKLKVEIKQFKKEFNSIRHGNYLDFLNLVKGPIPFMVTHQNGIITSDNTPRKSDCDFGLLLKSGPSLMIFYKKCISIYGTLYDVDISDEVYMKLVLFEIGLRMHANNNKLLDEKESLENVIIKLCKFKMIPETEIEKLQNGRRFLNMIKHHKPVFSSWKDGALAFEEAYHILNKHKFTIV